MTKKGITKLKHFRKGKKRSKLLVEQPQESTDPSAPATPVQTPNPEDWVAQIPPEIKYDIQHAIDKTKKDNKEKSLTFCRLKTEKKIHTSNFAFGKEMSTEVKPCNEKYGEQATKIGDFHSHPFGKMAMGITPSEADFSSTLYDSWENKNRQIGCISNHGSKMIHCYQPNKVPTWSKVNQYYNALDNTGGATILIRTLGKTLIKTLRIVGTTGKLSNVYQIPLQMILSAMLLVVLLKDIEPEILKR